jgi:GNAT superfamily N-acetyltransferase
LGFGPPKAQGAAPPRSLIAENGRDAVGFGQLDLPNGEIQAVYVSPDAQGRGVGGALLAHLEHLARREGAARITLKATLNAEAFYAAHGWRTVGRDVHKITQRISLTYVAMEKTVGPQ